MMMSRSRTTSSSRSRGRRTSSPRTSNARAAWRTGRRVQYTVDSRPVDALLVPPRPSMASDTARDDGSERVPRKVMCSMKCARPASRRRSSREPTSTVTATASERVPGIRAEMTRGPPGSTERWNIPPCYTGVPPGPSLPARGGPSADGPARSLVGPPERLVIVGASLLGRVGVSDRELHLDVLRHGVETQRALPGRHAIGLL